MRDNNPKPNVNIKSNVYIMPEDMATSINSLDILKTIENISRYTDFLERLESLRLWVNIPEKIKKIIASEKNGRCDFCSGHPEPRMTFGKIKKGDELIYSCRCDRKSNCPQKVSAMNSCDNCERNRG